MTDAMFRQEYLADIVIFTGAVYGEVLTPAIIDGTDEEMRFYFPEWPAVSPDRESVTGIDPGTDHPFAAVHLTASPRGLVVTGEYEDRGKPYLIHAQAIQTMRGRVEGRVGIDRSQAQAAIELAQYGLYTTTAENALVAGVNRVSAWMIRSQTHRVDGHPTGLILPRSRCPKLIRALQSYRWADQTKRDGSLHHRELVVKLNDDLPDALRYALMTWPHLPTTDPASGDRRRRVLDTLPAQVRHEIERMRRVEAGERGDDGGLQRVADTWDAEAAAFEGDTVPSGMGDFYN
jgi:hypothetical protein